MTLTCFFQGYSVKSVTNDTDMISCEELNRSYEISSKTSNVGSEAYSKYVTMTYILKVSRNIAFCQCHFKVTTTVTTGLRVTQIY